MNPEGARTIAMSGATGFVGTNLRNEFQEKGWHTVPVGRQDLTGPAGALSDKMNGAGIVVNLAGAPVIGRWTDAYKKVMYESRINVTRSLIEACSSLEQKPDLFVSTSAVGYYREEGTHTEEDHVRAGDFLGNLARDWESEALRAKGLGIRTVIFRFGVVLGKGGGALKQMITPFKLGLGGTIGDGSQPFSWVHMSDLVRAYITVFDDMSYEGIYNLTAPNPTTNKGVTHALGKALGMPTLLRIPKFALSLQFGQGAQVLTSGQTVLPKRLLDSGFTFTFPKIDDAVRDCVS